MIYRMYTGQSCAGENMSFVAEKYISVIKIKDMYI